MLYKLLEAKNFGDWHFSAEFGLLDWRLGFSFDDYGLGVSCMKRFRLNLPFIRFEFTKLTGSAAKREEYAKLYGVK